jgi:hypothetical protein
MVPFIAVSSCIIVLKIGCRITSCSWNPTSRLACIALSWRCCRLVAASGVPGAARASSPSRRTSPYSVNAAARKPLVSPANAIGPGTPLDAPCAACRKLWAAGATFS